MITLAGNARDFVSWYEQALAGAVFAKPETLTEFKRIQATSVQIPLTVPPDTPAYAKGGEFSPVTGLGLPAQRQELRWADGRRQGKSQTPVTFCFVVNWDNLGGRVPPDRDGVLRSDQGHSDGHQTGIAVTGTSAAAGR